MSEILLLILFLVLFIFAHNCDKYQNKIKNKFTQQLIFLVCIIAICYVFKIIKDTLP